MNSTNEQFSKVAIYKITELIKNAKICMLGESFLQWPLHPESINNQSIDDEGNIWIVAPSKEGESNIDVEDGNVQLFYANGNRSEFLSLLGSSTTYYARLDNYINQAKNEPSSSVVKMLKIIPHEAYYWDNKINDMVSIRLIDRDQAVAQKLCA